MGIISAFFSPVAFLCSFACVTYVKEASVCATVNISNSGMVHAMGSSHSTFNSASSFVV